MHRRVATRIANVGALVTLLTIGSAGSAGAATITLTTTELASFFNAGFTGFAPVATNNLGLGNYSTQWNAGADGFDVTQTNRIDIGPRGSAGDTFELWVRNNNGSNWNFSISLNAGQVGATSSATVSLAPQNTFVFSIPMLAALTRVDVTVGAKLPIDGTDRGAEYLLSVPDGGATLSLLGIAMLGLGTLRRRLNV